MAEAGISIARFRRAALSAMMLGLATSLPGGDLSSVRGGGTCAPPEDNDRLEEPRSRSPLSGLPYREAGENRGAGPLVSHFC